MVNWKKEYGKMAWCLIVVLGMVIASSPISGTSQAQNSSGSESGGDSPLYAVRLVQSVGGNISIEYEYVGQAGVDNITLLFNHLGLPGQLYMAQTVSGDANNIRIYIQELPGDAFKNNPDQRKNALSEKLDEVLELVNKGEYRDARDKVTHDLAAKVDGSLGGDAKNDWITDPEIQPILYEMLDNLTLHIEAIPSLGGFLLYPPAYDDGVGLFSLLPTYCMPTICGDSCVISLPTCGFTATCWYNTCQWHTCGAAYTCVSTCMGSGCRITSGYEGTCWGPKCIPTYWNPETCYEGVPTCPAFACSSTLGYVTCGWEPATYPGSQTCYLETSGCTMCGGCTVFLCLVESR